MIWRNLVSVNTATPNGIVSMLDRENSWPEAFGITLLLPREDDNLYPFMIDLSADGYGATELAMNEASNAA